MTLCLQELSMHFIVDLFNSFQAYAKTNPAIAGVAGLWSLGIITWFCRSLPQHLWNFIVHQLTTSLSFNNDQVGNNFENFTSFMKWFSANQWVHLSRRLSMDGAFTTRIDNAGYSIGMGDGRHFFRFKGKIFWMKRTSSTLGGTNYHQRYDVTITTLGRNRNLMLQLIEDFRWKPDSLQLGIYKYHASLENWTRVTDSAKRPLNTVIINQGLKTRILQIIEKYLVSKSWYAERGLPYKKTFILSGVHGTGKTSFIKALASHYDMSICLINIADHSDESFGAAMAYGPPRSIIVIEDIDTSDAVHSRGQMTVTHRPIVESASSLQTAHRSSGALTDLSDSTAGEKNGRVSLFNVLTLGGVLNALDGIVSLDDKIIFITTNRLNVLDPALTRKGRIDHIFEFTELGHDEVLEYINLMFPGEDRLPAARFGNILGCDIQDLYFDHADNYEAFIAALPKIGAETIDSK
jgi:chaperone BCS1